MRLIDFITESISKNLYSKKIEGLAPQMLENFSLILYCNKYDKYNLNLSHWKTELINSIKPLVMQDVKGGDKYKAIYNILIVGFGCDDVSFVSKYIKKKFIKENLVKYIDDISDEVSNNIDTLLELTKSKSYQELDEKVRAL